MASVYTIEIYDRGAWLPCEADHSLAVYPSKQDAEADARFAFSESERWRVVQHRKTNARRSR